MKKRVILKTALLLSGAVLICMVSLYAWAAFSVTDCGGKLTETETDILTIKSCLVRYQIQARAYPTTEQGLIALVEKPTNPPIPQKWTQKIEGHSLIDPWGSPYLYICFDPSSPDIPRVWSKGPDRLDETPDDIYSNEGF
jgi:type II secretion system protein G